MRKAVWRVRSTSMRWLAAGLIANTAFCHAGDSSAKFPAAQPNEAGLYMKVQLAHPIKFSKLKPGEIINGSLARDVYSADRKLFSAGSPVALSVDHLEKRKRVPNDHWPWIVKAFTPRHENYPIFRQARVLQDGGDKDLSVSIISMSRMREVQAKARKNSSRADGAGESIRAAGNQSGAPAIVMEAFSTVPANTATEQAEHTFSYSGPALARTLPIGTRCKIVLLSSVSASKNKPGDIVTARLLEPVLVDSKVMLPAGSYFKGRIERTTPPRWLSRSGSLHLHFTEVTLPDGNAMPLAASLAAAELDERSHSRIDAEGGLHGERPGKAWMAINLGVTSGLAKEVDDGMQLAIEAIISTATDASTAGTARLISSGASAVYMATRHGRDVVLPRFTVMDISLDRPLSLDRSAVTASNVRADRK